MPLSWIFSSMILLVIMLVILYMYSLSYFTMEGANKLNKETNFLLWW